MLVVVSLDVERFKKRFQGDDGSVRLTPCCSLVFVYNSLLFIVECLKWGMNVRCEHQCFSDLGLALVFLLLPQLVFNV